MSPAADLPVLWRLLRGMPRGGSHAERLEGFYRGQAAHYDRFRERLLHGRRELVESLELPEGGTLVELGAGTGRNAEFLGERLARLYRVHLVDLCPSLAALAEARAAEAGWGNVRVHRADAAAWRPERPVDAVLCAYSLTMIPDWFAAIDNAHAMLAPGGLFAAVDFFVARRSPGEGLARHSGFARHFWPLWFAHDGVHPSSEHLPYLRHRFATVSLHQALAPVPWLPGLRVPYYRFVGRRR